ncbi:MAG: hypothetical protein RL189_699 [Pseudomonadota bacterium]|jgi:hypothetical protein
MKQTISLNLKRLIKFFQLIAVLLFFVRPNSSLAQNDPLAVVRADAYELDVQSGRGNLPAKVTALWASGVHRSQPFRVRVPQRSFAGRKLLVHYQWSTGTAWAGLSERVEVHWKLKGAAWQRELLGEGFRDPVSGQLLLFPAELRLPDGYSGALELKFVLYLQNGDVVEERGDSNQLTLFADAKSSGNLLSFKSDWKISLSGKLGAGESFELSYDPERLIRQMNLQSNDPAPWCVVAHVRFDDGPAEEYPLVAVVSGQTPGVVSFVPTVVIPAQARTMSIWFLAFYNSQSYFDSNFGMNFNFEIAAD